MRRARRLLGVALLLLGWATGPRAGWLVEVNGQRYSTEHFLHWWENWREERTPPPATPDPFIDWLLLAQEAKRMGLDEEPSYRQKLRVFLEVRSLMRLKWEEVDRKISIEEEELRRRYRQSYTPLLRVRMVELRGKADVEELRRRLKENGKLPKKATQELWLRPRRGHLPWGKQLLAARPGQVLGPLRWRGRSWLLKVLERREGDERDFQRLRSRIRREVRKRQERELTRRLVERLKRKYRVWVNEPLLERLDLDHPRREELNEVLVRMGQRSVTVKEFLEQVVQRERAFREKYPSPPEEPARMKRRLLNAMISQTLTTWEALSRHYERRPPLKWTWWFYTRHRLIREFERHVLWPQVKVTERDVQRYYQEHAREFTQPGVVRMAVFETSDERLANRVRSRLQRGEDFFAAVERVAHQRPSLQRLPLDHLLPEVREALSKLAPGEVSPPLRLTGSVWLIKLLDRTPARPRPLEEVRETIRKRLRQQRFEEVRRGYLRELRSRSRIRLHRKAWERLRRRLEADDARRRAA